MFDRRSRSSRKATALAISLYEDYQRTGNFQLLQTAVILFSEAVDATPPGHRDRPGYLSNLGAALQIRFELTGEQADLDRAIAIGREAVDITPADHPDRPMYLSSLGNALQIRFGRTGQLPDLDQAITWLAEAVDVTPAGHLGRPPRLSNLGAALRTRFERTGEQADLDRAIAIGRQAVDITPADHPGRPMYLSNLGAALQDRFERAGQLADLDQAISRFAEAVDITPADHTNGPGYLSNLGAALQIRFEHAGQLPDLDQAISRFAEVIDIISADHPDRPGYLSNLGYALRVRFERTGEQADPDQAITIGRQAVDTAPADHPNRPGYLSNLGYALRVRFERAGQQADLDQAIEAYREGAGVTTASPGQRLAAAQAWGWCALLAGTPGIAVEAYAAAIDLLPLVAWHGLDQAAREHHLREWAGLASDAAAAAVAANDPARAVELLEAGRSILWTQVSHLRHDLAALRERVPDLAATLEASRAVLNIAYARVPGGPDATGDAGAAQAAEQQMLDARRQAARDWDAAVDQVRRIEGFEHFPQPAPVTDLGAAAAAGAVAIVNISQHGSHALIVTRPPRPGPDPEVRVVDLPAASVDTVLAQGNALLVAQRRTSDPAANRHAVFNVLDWSWQAVAEPVLAALGHTRTPRERIEDWPRVWWCPTGPATVIPLHAAGRHPRTAAQYLAMGEAAAVADSVAGRVISSYTSTLAALTQARTRPAPGQVRQLAVGVPEAPTYVAGASALPAVRHELQVLGRYLPAPEHATHLVGPAATQQAVLTALPGHSWLHLSCHGTQHPDDPSRSAFLLHDQPLTLADLAALNLREMDLANLSACQTARGDLRLLDEALHLAGALHLVGYRHVLATMWSIAAAAAIAGTTYAHLLHPDPDAPGPADQPQAARAPYALHQAITRLRQRHPGEPLLWAPYIHLGP